MESLTGINSNGFAYKYCTWVEVNGSGKHSSLLRYGNNYRRYKFYSTGSTTVVQWVEQSLIDPKFKGLNAGMW